MHSQFSTEGAARPCRLFRSVTETLDVALQFSRGSKRLQAIHDSELNRANELIKERW